MQRTQYEGTNELDEIRNEAESILKELGFSSYAAKSFLAISEYSPIAAASVCQKTGISDSKIYYALQELEEKGLVIKIAGTPQLYSALKPKEVYETLSKLIEAERERKGTRVTRLEKILRPLSKTSEKVDNLEIAYITRGLDNVIRRASKLLSSVEKQVVGYLWDEEIYAALAGDLKNLLSKDVKMRLALNPGFVKQGDRSLPVLPPSPSTKVLLCECNLLVVDGKKMISITRTRANSYYAIITEDPGMVSLGISYYQNPTCCSVPA